MKVAFLITDLDQGGAQTQLVRLVSQLNSNSYRMNLLVISMTESGRLTSELEKAGISLYSLRMTRGLGGLKGAIEFLRILRKERPVCLVSFLYHANVLGALIGRFARIPALISSHRSERFGGRARDWILRLAGMLNDVAVVNSQATGVAIVARDVISSRKLRIIPNAIDPEWLREDLFCKWRVRKELGVREDAFLWLAVGRLEPPKDQANLLTAFRKVVAENPRAVLLVVGDGPSRGALENLAVTLGLNDRVMFLGHRNDVQALLAGADGFVLSSTSEGLPNAIMEAMATGVPVVATGVGGIAELVSDGETGYLVPPHNPAELAQAMLHLMDLPDAVIAGVTAAARNHIKVNFDLQCVTDQWLALIEELLGRKLCNQDSV